MERSRALGAGEAPPPATLRKDRCPEQRTEAQDTPVGPASGTCLHQLRASFYFRTSVGLCLQLKHMARFSLRSDAGLGILSFLLPMSRFLRWVLEDVV